MIYAVEDAYGLAIKNTIKSSMRLMRSVCEKGVVVGGGIYEKQLANHMKQYALNLAAGNVLHSDIANAYANSVLSIPEKLKANGRDATAKAAAASSNVQESSLFDAINVKTSALTFATNAVVKFLKYTFKNQPSPSNIHKGKQFGLKFRSPSSTCESSPLKMSAQQESVENQPSPKRKRLSLWLLSPPTHQKLQAHQKSVSLSNRDALASIPNPVPPNPSVGAGAGTAGSSSDSIGIQGGIHFQK